MVLSFKHNFRGPARSAVGGPSPDTISIKLASPDSIKGWTRTRFRDGVELGAVTSGETLHYRTLKPIFGGLFCERLFGPVRDWECHCGRVRMGRLPVIEQWCPKCVVQITRSRCRRYRFAFIPLGTPITHMWYRQNDKLTNPFRRLLWLRPKDISTALEAQCVVLADLRLHTPCTLTGSLFNLWSWDVLLMLFWGDRRQHPDDICAPWKQESSCMKTTISFATFRYLPNMAHYGFWALLDRRPMALCVERFAHHLRIIRSADDFMRLTGQHWAYALCRMTKSKTDTRLRRDLRRRATRVAKHRHILVSAFVFARQCVLSRVRPSWAFVQYLPVLPPALRPILRLENGTLAISDLNQLYRLVLFRATRLRKLMVLQVPEIILVQEIRLVETAVSAVFDNQHLRYPIKRDVMFEVKAPLQSISDRIVGKEGRFRQNLLGKRVDYSGRSVIIVGPTLNLWECGLPHEMALTLFQPLVLHRLLASGVVSSLQNAKRFVSIYPMTTYKVLRRAVRGHPVVLNRAPTLHRMGMQAFLPRIIPGRAIQLHPFVCPAFNADFDGDQMAVHIPLCPQAVVEARLLLCAPMNWVSPATGGLSLLPSQDIILGLYYLTVASCTPRAERANDLHMHSLVWLRSAHVDPVGVDGTPILTCVSSSGSSYTVYESSIEMHTGFHRRSQVALVTTAGRHLVHTYIPHPSPLLAPAPLGCPFL